MAFKLRNNQWTERSFPVGILRSVAQLQRGVDKKRVMMRQEGLRWVAEMFLSLPVRCSPKRLARPLIPLAGRLCQRQQFLRPLPAFDE
jgi:hypothetical protein